MSERIIYDIIHMHTYILLSVTCNTHTLTDIRSSNENDGLHGACQYLETTLSSVHRHLASLANGGDHREYSKL